MEYLKKCGCKGIRTCLICEKDGHLSKLCDETKETVQYRYCPHCDLCWPVGAGGRPLYLGRLTLVPDFVDEEEESALVANIDRLEWMPSQSGRRKQDFGPKVNFKKKKSKIGDFKGFPSFTESLVKRLDQCEDLADFRSVELCHLDYDPDRGSAIEPHMDDTWIWGERLVTLNLVSSTILTFTPANTEAACDCPTRCLEKHADVIDGNEHCNHIVPLDHPPVFPTRDPFEDSRLEQNKVGEPLECQTKYLGTTELSYSNGIKHSNKKLPLDCFSKRCSVDLLGSCPAEDVYQIGQSDSEVHLQCQDECLKTHVTNTVNELKLCSHNCPVSCLPKEDSLNLKDLYEDIGPKGPQTNSDNQTQRPKSHEIRDSNGDIHRKDPNTICEPQTKCNRTNERSIKGNNQEINLSRSQEKVLNGSDAIEDMCTSYRTGKNKQPVEDMCTAYRTGRNKQSVEDMCTAYRTGQNKQTVEVLVPLPPRSLVVVAGCSRHNWFHEIKRKDINSRRLAMTFRELAPSFMAGGPDETIGSQLLELGRTFWEMKT